MFTRSIRWRFLLWLAFLLVVILGGFGVTAYQLHRTNRFSQIDEDLQTRLGAVSGDTRPPPPFGVRGGGPPPFGGRGGPPPFGERGEWAGPGGPDDRGGKPAPDEDGGRRFSPGGPFREHGGPRGFGDFPPRIREIRLSARTQGFFDETETNGFYYAIWSGREAILLKRSTNAPGGLQRPEKLADTTPRFRTREPFREAYHFTELGECVLVGRSITTDLKATQRFATWLIGAGAAVLAFGLGGGWWLGARALRPVEDISAAATRISAGNLSERVSGADEDNELGRLAGVLNHTFARLESAFAQQKQFTADASHELRTPIAVLISEAQTTLARERSAAEYRETVEACLETAQQMRQLTESLLALARLDAGQEQMEREPFDLAQTARACVAGIRPLADRRGVRIHEDLQPAATIGDADRFKQVITNLLANAINYNRPEGEIRITTRVEDGAAVLTVADTGMGIAAEDLPHLFERFYRADKARGRASGNSGLGLAISQAIVAAHKGTITVVSEPGHGAMFTVRVPGQSAG